MKPPRSILDPAFKYVPPAKQDCAATFRRIRRELAEQALQTSKVVAPIRKAPSGKG